MLQFRNDLSGLETYKIDNKGKYNLGDNENRLIDWSDCLGELTRSITVEDLMYYGDNKYAELLESMATYLDLPSNQVVQGVGSDQMIQTIVSTFLSAGDVLLTVAPDFFMYQVFSQIHGVQVAQYSLEWKEGAPSLSVEGVLTYAEEVDAKALILSNPNNPTSVAFPSSQLEEIVRRFDGLVVIDEAYIEFSNQPSFVKKVQEYEHLIVLRTLSKAFGLAGLRAGFAICCERLAIELDKVLAPYSMPNPVARIATEALKQTDKVHQSIEDIVELRQDFIDFLQEQDSVTVLPSQANFVSFTAPYAERIYDVALAKGFNFKYYSSGAIKGYIRMSIGRVAEMKKMKKLIAGVVSDEKNRRK